jgi:hypothetical protein
MPQRLALRVFTEIMTSQNRGVRDFQILRSNMLET